ncbi:MAG: hypothetical protein GY866_27010 [Proteobacteria bacterium]|nr:hypothetical protein [Pseudomonadota bacterium]
MEDSKHDSELNRLLGGVERGAYETDSQDGDALSKDRQPDGASRDELLDQAAGLESLSPEAARAYLECSPPVVAALSKKEFGEWVAGGRNLLERFPNDGHFCISYFQSSSRFLNDKNFGSLDNWVKLALQLAEYSVEAAARFFQSTPEFLEHDNFFHIREWVEKIRQILFLGEGGQDTAIGYIESSIEILRVRTFRELLSWTSTGLKLARKSTSLAQRYFSEIPEKLESLYLTETRKIYELTAIMAEVLPGKAIEFYRQSPAALLELNPNVRENVLDTVKKNTQLQPEKVMDHFEEIVAGVRPLFYPVQETVLKNETAIGAISTRASSAYFRNVGTLLDEAHESFLPHWVEKGCSLLAEDERSGIDYFGFDSAESENEFSRWKEAVFLEDCKNPLTIFARALTGKELRLKSTQTSETEEFPASIQYPSADERIVHLPPFFAEEQTSQGNFRQYKVATAHQAGYLEFGTFEPRFPTIRAFLNGFPLSELALDIFFILEDGRIDYNLKKEYAGLALDMDCVLEAGLEKRDYHQETPLQEALEVLLRLTVGHLDEERVSPLMSEYLVLLKSSLDGFYRKGPGVWDCFTMTIELYDLLKTLALDDVYLPVDGLAFREIPDLDLLSSAGLGDEIPDEIKEGGEDSEEDPGELSEEDIKKLMELLEKAKLTEPLKKGKANQGLFITNIDGLVAHDEDDDQVGIRRTEENAAIASAVSRSICRQGPFYYDEWDYLQQAYRRRWCCLRELAVEPTASERFDKIYGDYEDLIKKVKMQFQRIRPEVLEPVRRVEWGSEIDFNAMIQSRVDRKAGDTPSDRIFARREKKLRRISTLLLIDMSASTDRLASSVYESNGSAEAGRPDGMNGTSSQPDEEKKIIDIEMEGLVVMTEALEALDDEYAIFGFSGYGREQVDMYAVKDFNDPYNQELKSRICSIQPKKSTRMGAAIRHATARLKPLDTDHRLLIMLSDGYPQDTNYGEDRTSQEYALHDTMMALIEAKKVGIRPFCITVDQCGDDYLRKMCDPASYLVLQDIYSLPLILPKVVESLMG